MGWCSGTDVFDPMVKFILQMAISDIDKRAIIAHLVVTLQDHDWDCESDSAYYGDPLVQSVFQELHPEWFEIDE